MLRTILLSAMLLLTSQVAHAQRRPSDCVTERVLFANNANVPFKQAVRAGKTCSVRTQGGLGRITSVQILKAPRSGTLKVTGANSYTYTARQGYNGADQYQVRFVGYAVDLQGNKSYDVYYELTGNVSVGP